MDGLIIGIVLVAIIAVVIARSIRSKAPPGQTGDHPMTPVPSRPPASTGFGTACSLACVLLGALFLVQVGHIVYVVANGRVGDAVASALQGVRPYAKEGRVDASFEFAIVFAMAKEAGLLLVAWLFVYWLGQTRRA